jgi:hypothetical protein
MFTRRCVVPATSLMGCAGIAMGLPSAPPSIVTPQTSPRPVVAPGVDASATFHAGIWASREPRGGGGADGPCFANCDGSTTAPVLTANDFQCFLDAKAACSLAADCNGNGLVCPDPGDYICFMTAYASGCS